jgi:hypothetical protein
VSMQLPIGKQSQNYHSGIYIANQTWFLCTSTFALSKYGHHSAPMDLPLPWAREALSSHLVVLLNSRTSHSSRDIASHKRFGVRRISLSKSGNCVRRQFSLWKNLYLEMAETMYTGCAGEGGKRQEAVKRKVDL